MNREKRAAGRSLLTRGDAALSGPASSRNETRNGKPPAARRRIFPKAGGWIRRAFASIFPRESYPPFRLPAGKVLAAAAGGAAAGYAVGYLFYRGAGALFPVIPGAYVLARVTAHKYARRRKRILTEELKDWLLSVTGFLRTGFALENAMREAAGETETMHGAGSMMAAEAREMVRLLSLQTPPEMMLRDFAARTGLADAAELARVIAVAKRLGGNYLPVLKRMASAMEARRMVREETEAALAGQKLEYHIMCLVPAGILLYLNLTSPDLTAGLYAGGGRILMAAALPFYLMAVLVGDRMLEKCYDGR